MVVPTKKPYALFAFLFLKNELSFWIHGCSYKNDLCTLCLSLLLINELSFWIHGCSYKKALCFLCLSLIIRRTIFLDVGLFL